MELEGVLADRTAWTPVGHCPIEKALELVGSRTAILTLREAYYGTTRFEHFCERVGMARAATSTRLKSLVDAGLMERRSYQDEGSRARDEYVLTPSGRALEPVVLGLLTWSEDHLDLEGMRLSHPGCTEPIQARLVCAAGHIVADDELRAHVPNR